MAAEKNFENKVKCYLKMMGSWYIKYWGGAKFTKEGIPDILACINGKFYGIEIKAKLGKPTLLQLINLDNIRNAGGYGVLLYPDDFDGFQELVRGSILGFKWYNDNLKKQDQWLRKLDT